MAKATEISRQRGILRSTKATADAVARRPSEFRPGGDIPDRGQAIVQRVTPFGRGCVCDVEVMAGGRSTGIPLVSIECPARLELGAVVGFIRRPDGKHDLVAGGGSGGTTIIGGSTTIAGGIVYAGFWSE